MSADRTLESYFENAGISIRSAGVRIGIQGEPEDLAVLVRLQRTLDAAIVTAVSGLRRNRWTWASIGEAIGITRQAALMRFGPEVKRREESVRLYVARKVQS